MKRRKLAILVTIGVGTLAGALVGEAAVRALGLAPPIPVEYAMFVASPHMPFGPRPLSHRTGRCVTGEFDFDYRHNSLGFRDDEHAIPKPAGTFRILALGDSFSYGVGARYDETYLCRVERALRSSGRPDVEIVKAGVPRFFPEPERMLLEGLGDDFGPDLVVVAFLPNDVIDTHLGLGSVTVDESGFLKTRRGAELGALAGALYERSHLCRLLLSRYLAWRSGDENAVDWAAVYEADGPYEADWKRIEAEYDRIKACADRVDAKLLVVHIPQQGPWTDAHDYPAHRLQRWADASGAGFLDCLPAFRRASASPALYYPRDGHCTPEGYAIVADELTKHLIAHDLVPR